jgi:hypothetical protein
MRPPAFNDVRLERLPAGSEIGALVTRPKFAERSNVVAEAERVLRQQQRP